MDTISHTLIGLTIGALRRRDHSPGDPPSPTDRAVLITTALAANLPDLDVLFMVTGPLGHIRFHRALTHSLAFAVLLAGLLAWWSTRRWPGARAGTVFNWSLAAVVGGHLLPDWANGFGTQILLPLSGRRLALDWLSLTEPLIILPLVALLLVSLWRPRLRRTLAVSGLVLALAVVGWRGWLHGRLRAEVAARYDTAVAAVSVHPVDWRLKEYGYVVERDETLHVGRALAGRTLREWGSYHKPPDTDPVLQALQADPRGQALLAFARHPLLTYEWVEDEIRALVWDLRGPFAFQFRADLGPELLVRRIWRVHESADPAPPVIQPLP